MFFQRALCFIVLVTLLAGCSTSGVLQISDDTYMVSKTSAAGAFASRSGMQAAAIREANEFAAKKGKVAVALGTQWERPVTGFPTFEYQFMLVDRNDPRAKGVSLVPRADVVVEKNEKVSVEEHPRAKNNQSARSDLYAELMKLDDLKQKGILTEAEFKAEKEKLLGGK